MSTNTSVDHHTAVHRVTTTILQKWKNHLWMNDFVSTEVFLTNNAFGFFPIPDSAFEDPFKKTKILLEFKPFYENKRGIMTGLGQSIGYLVKSNASILNYPIKLLF